MPIAAAALLWPSGRLDGAPVDGPDEDAFTLAVEAIGRLPASSTGRAVARIRPFGTIPPRCLGDLAEAAGFPSAPVEAVRPLSEIWGALVDPPGSPPGAGDLTVLVTPVPGLSDGTDEASAAAIAIERTPTGPRRVSGPVAVPGAPEGAGLPRSTLDLLGVGVGQEPILRKDLGSVPDQPGGTGMWTLSFWSALSEPSGAPLLFVGGGAEADALYALSGPAPLVSGEIPPRSGGWAWKDRSAWLTRPSEEPPTLSEGAYVPRPTYLAQRPSRWRLAAGRCSSCGRVTFPLRPQCGHCASPAPLTTFELPHRGLRVDAVTVVHPGAQPTEFDRQAEASGAYAVLIVEAAPGARVTLQWADPDPAEVHVGDRVDVALRRLIPMEGQWRYGLKAVRSVPAEPGGAPPAVLRF